MPNALDTLRPIVTNVIYSAAQDVIDIARRNTHYPYLIDAKLGDTEKAPMFDVDIASRHDTPLYTITIEWKEIAYDLVETDAQHGSPLGQIAQRANDALATAAIPNRHNRRPPLYAESTIGDFIKLEFSTPERAPLIRAAGHVVPPPIFPRTHDLGPIIADFAAHMAASHEAQTVAQIHRALENRHDLLAKWPHLNLTLFIRRVAGICHDDQGFYHPDQPRGNRLSAQRPVASTVLRILARDQEPRNTDYLTVEVQRLVRHFLPDGYNTRSAVRATLSRHDEITWQGRATFGLRKWDTALGPQNMVARRGRASDLIYAFLMEHARRHRGRNRTRPADDQRPK